MWPTGRPLSRYYLRVIHTQALGVVPHVAVVAPVMENNLKFVSEK